jgi:signal transduction histidine kinase
VAPVWDYCLVNWRQALPRRRQTDRPQPLVARHGGSTPTDSGGPATDRGSDASSIGVDVTLAIVVLCASVVNLASQDGSGISAIPIAGFVLLGGGSVAVVWRRNRSVAVLGAALAMTVAWAALGFPGNPVFHIVVSLYAVGRYLRESRTSLAALAIALAVVGVVQSVDGDPASEVVTALLVAALPWYVGRRLRIRADAAQARLEYLEWKRETEAQRTIADARAAIARELHDVVAHNVSVMTVQAGVARLVVSEDAERARDAIRAVEDAGRRALDELRQLLGVLRPESPSGDLGPQPALGQLGELVEQLTDTGMTIDVEAELSSGLPARVELFAYRIVQEALTNVLKHGGIDATARVHLEEADGYLNIEVTDTGSGTSESQGSGHGIVGMKERALLLGGTLDAGPLPEGGFRVLSRLPIGDQ